MPKMWNKELYVQPPKIQPFFFVIYKVVFSIIDKKFSAVSCIRVNKLEYFVVQVNKWIILPYVKVDQCFFVNIVHIRFTYVVIFCTESVYK